MDDIRYWLALLHAPGIGAVSFARLLARFPDPAQLFQHIPPENEVGDALGRYLREPDWSAVETDLAWVEGEGRQIVTLGDPRYPERLRCIADPPPLLFLQGNIELLGSLQLAIVGSRNPTATGKENAIEFARHLAALGVTITSGLALGIDAASHRGALAAQGATVAVTGTGPDRVYPARNRDLAHAIVDGGGLMLSEFAPGTPPLAANFPRRNRIISGLSVGTLVVEAALRSGSLITARQAVEQGREVFALPGSIHNPLARGCHRLIREGAKLVETAADILEELAPQLRPLLEEQTATAAPETQLELDKEYRHLLDCLGDAPAPVDLLVTRSGLTAAVVSSMLLQLELQGLVASTAMGYMRTSKSY